MQLSEFGSLGECSVPQGEIVNVTKCHKEATSVAQVGKCCDAVQNFLSHEGPLFCGALVWQNMPKSTSVFQT